MTRRRSVTYEAGQGLSFQEGVTELQASLVVYEATEEDGSLRIESAHIVVKSFEQVLRVSEVLVLGNTSDRTFIGQVRDEAGGQAATVFIPLPANAVGLALPEGEPVNRFAEVEGGLWDTQPVRPGANASVLRFSYHLPVEGAAVPLERRFPFPVSSITILAVQPGLTVRGDQLTVGETVTFQDTEYQAYTAGSLGTEVPFKPRRLPLVEEIASLSTTSSTMLSHESQPGQRPKAREVILPQTWQTYWVCSLGMG